MPASHQMVDGKIAASGVVWKRYSVQNRPASQATKVWREKGIANQIVAL